MKRFNMVLLIIVSLFLSSCYSDKLIFITKTSTGLDVGVAATDNGLHFGYKRLEGVIDPLRCEGATGDKKCKAQSVIAKLNFGSRQADNANVNVAQWFATGDAATELAKKPDVALALIGKDVSFQKGLNLSQLSLIKTIYSEYKETGKNKEIIDSIDDISKNILLKFAKGMGEGENCSSINGFADLVPFYNKVNKNKTNALSPCELKDDQKSHQLNKEIDIKLGSLIARMMDGVKQLIGG